MRTKNSGEAGKTKSGPRRVRQEAPTVEEALTAAQGLSEDLDQQAEIAAALMGLPYDEVHAALLKTAAPRKDLKTSVVFAGPASAPRTIVVERKPSRRVVGAADRPQRI